MQTAELLASGRIEAVDIAHLRDEIEGLSLRDEREVVSRVKRIMQHLLKLEHEPEKRTRSWESTLADQRGELEMLFEQSPSLSRIAKSSRERAYKRARRVAATETGLPEKAFPAEFPYTLAQVLDPEFVPGR